MWEIFSLFQLLFKVKQFEFAYSKYQRGAKTLLPVSRISVLLYFLGPVQNLCEIGKWIQIFLILYFAGIFIRFLEDLENQIKQYLIEIFSITNLTLKDYLFSGCPELQKNHQWGSEVDSLDKFSYPKSCQEACLIDSDCADGKIMLLNIYFS